MGYLPLFADVCDRPCLVIGGDTIAEGRVRALLDAGAAVTVVAPAMTTALDEWERQGQIRVLRRRYLEGDLSSSALVCCTDLSEDLVAIAAAARVLRVPLNVTDRPALSSFIFPAVVRRGDLQIAISTSGASPALASLLRTELEQLFGPEYAPLLALLRAVRERLQAAAPAVADRNALARRLALELRSAMLEHDQAALERILYDRVGITLQEVGIVAPGAR